MKNNKTKKDIKDKVNIFKRVVVLVKHKFANIKAIHERIKELPLDSLKDVEPSNPYDLLRNWLIDNVTSGVLLTIAYNSFFGWQGWYNIGLVIGLSLSYHIIPDAIKQILRSIREK